MARDTTAVAREFWEPFTTPNGQRLYGCAKRGCDAVRPAWASFGAGGKGYCLDHIPLRYRLKTWWQERRRP